MPTQKLSVFSKVVLVLNSLAVISLLLSYLASYISPEGFWIIGLFGIAYPVLLILNILFIVYWTLAWNKLVLLSLLAVAVGYVNITNTFQYRNTPLKPGKDAKTIRILSYNVRLFDLYNWTGANNTRSKMYQLLSKSRPDIACIQEFYSSTDKKGLNSEDSLNRILKSPNHHIEYTESIHHGNWGMATYSKYPIVNKGKIFFNEKANNLCIYTDIAIGKDTVRVYNVHFQSIRFENEDYEFVKSISDNKQREEIQGSKKILKRLKIAFIKRARQVDTVSQSIRSSPYPVIICGDFNDTPSSYTYHTLRHGLKDAFVESGRGIGNTYNGVFPSFRIDYIFHDSRFSSYSFQTIHRKFSDHFPITCVIGL